MNKPTEPAPRISPRLLLAGRVFLSLLAAYGFLYVLALITGAHTTYLKSRQLRASPPPLFLGNPTHQPTQTRHVDPLWPEFPHSGPSNLHQSLINGVEILSEDWETTAAADEILSYYRQQMVARGWADATEEAYGLQPQLRQWGPEEKGLQSQKYVDMYQKVMSSSLALRQGNWSLHVLVEPRKGTLGGSFVRIYAAATPSIKEFFHAMTVAQSRDANGQPVKRPIDAVQVSGGERYHTVVEVKPLNPEQALEQEVARFRDDGWKPLAASPTRSRAGASLWLTKGDAYAMVMVEPSAAPQSSTVTVTKVTPEHAR